MSNFQPAHYQLLLPLKQKWETFKVAKHVSILLHERAPLTTVYKDLKGMEPRWNCSECVIQNFRFLMNQFDNWEKENVPDAPQVEVKQEVSKKKSR